MSGTAMAQSTELTREGVELRRTGRDAEALAVFERALAIDGSPRTRAQVALAEQALGLWVDAERELTAALSSGNEEPWFAQHRSALELALDVIRARLGTLNVNSNVPGAELWLNGSLAGKMPLDSPLRVVAGRIEFEVRASGFETQSRSLLMEPETRRDETIELVQAPARTPSTTDAQPRSAPASARSQHDVGPEPGTGNPGARTAAWASLGGSMALLAGASVALLISDSNAALYNDPTRCFFGTLTRDQRCGSYRQAGDTARTLAIIGFGAAGLATGASIILFVSGHPQEQKKMGIRCNVGLGIACGASF
jgi:hypothetical protein